jgi:DNA polymerase III epsilon subunit-like protein
MSIIIVDIEADGPIPPDYSMVSFGAVIVESSLSKTFYGEIKPISEKWIPDALAISGFSREKTLTFREPEVVMNEFKEWLEKNNTKGRPIFMSDNLAFDWQWINYYFHKYTGSNPFGYSGRRLGDLYCGLVKDSRAKWKHLRQTKHDHNPVNDAKGNAEVVLLMQKDMGLKIDLY